MNAFSTDTASCENNQVKMPEKSCSGTCSASALNAPEIIHVAADTDSVRCDGGHGALGHPAVYYRFDEGVDRVICGYCDREFIRSAS